MHTIVIYGQPRCRFCTEAKQFCELKRFAYDYRDIAVPGVRAELLRRLPAPPKTVPQIFIGDTHVGGFDDMVKLSHEGKLQQIIGGF